MMNINSKLNPFGNVDDDVPVGYWPNKPQWLRLLLWWVRNPLHNFMFHWIGVHDYVLVREKSIWGVGWRLSWVYTKHLKLPLISYRGRYVEGYVGWRPNGGFSLPVLRKSESKQH